MHSKNIHNTPYNFKELAAANPKLIPFVIINSQKIASIDFSDNKAVLELNKAILMHNYGLNDWSIPKGYLCPPIPGRADYIHHIADFLKDNKTMVRNSIKIVTISFNERNINYLFFRMKLLQKVHIFLN